MHAGVRLPTPLVARQLNSKNQFLCPRSYLRIWSHETGSAVPFPVGLLILHTWLIRNRLNLVLIRGIPPAFRDGVEI